MKKIKVLVIVSFIFVMCFMFFGCLGEKNVETLATKVVTTSDSQLILYSDADVTKNIDGTTKTDDTTLLILGIKEGVNNVDKIFKSAFENMIKPMYELRSKVYNSWVNKSNEKETNNENQ